MSPLRLALPIRTSERRDGGMSPRQQRDRADEVVRRSGGRYEIAHVFDPGKSESGKTMDRTSLHAIRAGIRAGEYDGIIVGYLDRLGRAPIEESMTFVRELIGDGGVLVAADWSDEPIDLVAPDGFPNRWVESMLVQRLQMNRDQWLGTAERHRENKATAKRDGKFVGIAPFGYVKRGGRLFEHPVEGPVVRELYRVVAAGTLADGIDYLAAAAPERTRRIKGRDVTYAAKWGTDNVRKLLLSRTYLGEHGSAGTTGYRPHDPLTNEPTWQAARTKLGKRHKRPHGDYVLSGLVYCECGGTLTGQLQTQPALRRVAGDWRKHEPDPDAPKRLYERYRCGTCAGASCRADGPSGLVEYVRNDVADALADERVRADLMPDGVEDALADWERAKDELAAYANATSALGDGFALGAERRAEAVVAAEREYRRLVGLSRSFEVFPTAAEVRADDAKLAAGLRLLASRGVTLALRRGRGSFDDRLVWRKNGEDVPRALAA